MTTTPLLAADIAAQVKQWFDMLGPIGKYVGALLIFIIGRIVAKAVGKGAGKAASKAGIDSKLSGYVGDGGTSLSGLIATLVSSILLLFVLIFALDFAGLDQVTQPLNDMFGKVVGFLPNIVGAGIIGYLGFFLANVIKTILQNVLTAAKVDQRLGMASGGAPMAKGLSTAAFALVLLFIIPAALGVLGIKEISEPIEGIVTSVTAAVPKLLLAAVLLTIGIFVGNIARRLVTNLLQGVGADNLPAKVGLSMAPEGPRSVSSIAGLLVFISIVVLIGSTALQALDLEILGNVSENLVDGYFRVLLALVILGAGLLAAKFAHGALKGQNELLANIARAAIIVVSSVAALDKAGIAPDITGAPYRFGLGALAVAIGIGGGIALGLGGKDHVAAWLEKRRNNA